jgi:type IX secretion system PorP/SprF family membrane protein
MKYTRLKSGFFAIICSILISFDAKGQDPSYSQFNLNQLYYNPAYTGYQYGYHITATYRTLWPSVPGNKFPGTFATYHGWFDGFVDLPRGMYLGLGAFAMQNFEGQGNLKTTSGGISFAAHFPKIMMKQDLLPRLKISIGSKVYFNSVSVDWDKLVFTDQLDQFNGIIGASAFGATGITRRNYFDFDLGGLVLNNFMGKDIWYNEFGFSAAHILRPNISLTGSTENSRSLPRKFVASYRSTVNIAKGKIYIGPTILFENQGSQFTQLKNADFYELNTGMDLFIKPNPKSAVIPLTISLMNRCSIIQDKVNTNAIIIGLTHKGLLGTKPSSPVYYVGAAVDLPYMGVGLQTAGAYEVTLGIIFPPKGNNGFSKCPYSSFDQASGNSAPFSKRGR